MKRSALVLALLAAGCMTRDPAPITYGGVGSRAPSSPTPAPAAVEPGRQAGGAPIEYRNAGSLPPAPADNPTDAEGAPPSPPPAQAPDWAAGEGTPLSAYALRPEEAQPFDPARLPATHRVGANESLYDVATRYQVPLRALIEQNRLEPPYAVAPGSELRLPPPRFHVVARGETFADVARLYNVDLRSLGLLNRMRAPYRVRPGDRVVLPALARAIEPLAPVSSPQEPSPQASVAATAAADARFLMPLRGAVVARFGVQPGGARLDGLEIAGREGDAVTAAADGEVVYAGADLPAYGTLVLLRHPGNYVTAYGFARRSLVREGQRVRAGQHIAELGSRPDGGARLLFQVRLGSAAIDPAPLLGIRD
jgi:murein DD-endopeptidase MepM/ murein hydrolase activator NlpD